MLCYFFPSLCACKDDDFSDQKYFLSVLQLVLNSPVSWIGKSAYKMIKMRKHRMPWCYFKAYGVFYDN